MQTVRSSARSASADSGHSARAVRGAVARAFACTLPAMAMLATVTLARAQDTPALRLAGRVSEVVTGTSIGGAAAYPARTLERLGFTLARNAAGFTAAAGADTLRFWTTSPFFSAGASLHQLAFPMTGAGEAAHLPEQFFIQWLPAAYPDRFAFRDGALVVRGADTRAAAADTRAVAADTRAVAARMRVVVIDPGHGGRDPGRIGPNGLREKDVTLMISQRLAALLRVRGYEVHLTRTTDTLIALADRPVLANRWRGERPVAVFLSIHANAVDQSSARGFETFFLSEARTADEQRVAEMENEAIRFEEDPVAPADDGLGRILANLRSDFLLRASHDLATVVQEKLAAFHPGPNRGVKRAPFHVLVGTIMPAVLVETAFISNPAEAELLASQAFQQKITWGIADAVDEFFLRNEHLWEPGP